MIYNFYHVTDTHYYSKRNYKYDYVTAPQANTEICMRASEEALKKAFEIIGADEDAKTVIITGDLTNHGDAYSHEEVVELLKQVNENGIDTYVVTDSHDYPDFDVHDIDENGKKVLCTEHLERPEVVPMYYPFGRDKGFDSFSGDDTTYIAEILPGLFYIALGYDTDPEERGCQFSDGLMAWIKSHVEKAKAKGGVVICGIHRPIVPPSPAYAVMGSGNNVFFEGEKIMKDFADMGIRLLFSGHTHIQKMKEIVSDKGNKIYSVQTSSLVGYPPKMRKITIDTDNSTVDIRTIDLDLPELNLGMSFTEYARKGFLGIVEGVPYNMEHDLDALMETDGGITIPKDLIEKFPKVIMFIGRKVNGLTYETVGKFSKKYHNLSKSDLAALKDKKFINLVFGLVSNLYRGNADYSPDTPEYKIMMGTMKKLEKLLSVIPVDIKKILGGHTLSQVVEPLLYNSGLDDDNVSLKVNFN